MTANHARAMWQIGFLTATPGALQCSLRRKMLYPFKHVDDEIAVDDSAYGIRPYVVPNPFTSDVWGVALPAGLVLVLTAAGTHGSGDFATRFDAYLQSVWSNGGSPGTLVPGVLPSGYTPNLLTPWVVSQTNYFDAVSSLAYVATASGWTQQQWTPSSSPNGSTGSFLFGSLVFTGLGDGFISYGAVPATGYRSISAQLIYPSGSPVVLGGAGNVTLSFSHNADGSDPGAADGGVSDCSVSFVDADFSYVAGTGMVAPFKLAGSALAARGVMTTFKVHAHTASAGGLAAFTAFLRLSPRLDVPWPMTVTGEGDLIAPGGTP